MNKKIIIGLVCISGIAMATNMPTTTQVDDCYFSDDNNSGYIRNFKGCDIDYDSASTDDEDIKHIPGNCRVVYKGRGFRNDIIGKYSIDIQIKKEAKKFKITIPEYKNMLSEPSNICQYRRWQNIK